MVKLDESRISWIIKCKKDGIKNADIAAIQKISVRRIQQIWSSYKHNNEIPLLNKPGRPPKPITPYEVQLVRHSHRRFCSNALYLESYIHKTYGIKINHNCIHRINRLSVEHPQKKTRRSGQGRSGNTPIHCGTLTGKPSVIAILP